MLILHRSCGMEAHEEGRSREVVEVEMVVGGRLLY